MVGSGSIITKYLRRILTDKQGTVINQLRNQCIRIFHVDLQMFRCILIRILNCLVQAVYHADLSKRIPGLSRNLCRIQNLQLFLYRLNHALSKCLIGCQKNAFRIDIMLGLCQQICRYHLRARFSVRDYQDLARPSYKVDADLPVALTFRLGYEAVTRPYNNIHRLDALSSIGKCCDRLCTAQCVDLIHASQIHRYQRLGIDMTRSPHYRRAGGDTFYTRCLRRSR